MLISKDFLNLATFCYQGYFKGDAYNVAKRVSEVPAQTPTFEGQCLFELN